MKLVLNVYIVDKTQFSLVIVNVNIVMSSKVSPVYVT